MRINSSIVKLQFFWVETVGLTLAIWVWTAPMVGAVADVLELGVDVNKFPKVDITAPKSTFIDYYEWSPSLESEINLKLFWALAKSRAVTAGNNKKPTFRDYCKAWRTWEKENCIIDIRQGAGYCEPFQTRWSVWAEAVQAEKYSGGSLAVVLLSGIMTWHYPTRVGVLVTDLEQEQVGNYAALIRGHYPWGGEVNSGTVVYLPAPQSPGRWCRVWATGCSLIVSHGQNYTLVHTSEEIIHGEPPQPAGLLLPHLRRSRIITNAKCSSFGFPHNDLKRVDAKVVECSGTPFQSLRNPAALPPASYFCAELEQDLSNKFPDGVGWRFEAATAWDLSPGDSWPIFCQNLTMGNSVCVEGDGDGSYVLAGFLRHLNVVGEKVFAVFTYFDFHQV